MRRNIARLLGMLLTILIPVTAFLFVYDVASTYEYDAFWGRSPAALMLYGRTPEEKYIDAYTVMARRARAMGFAFTDPQLVQANDLFNIWYVRWTRSPMIGVSNDGGRYLMIDPLWMVQFTDDELDCVFAHEIGHVIDFQGKSADHPVMKKLACQSIELRADGIGEYLCGRERFQEILGRHLSPESFTLRSIGKKICTTDPVL